MNGILTAPPAALAQLARAVSRKTHPSAGRCDILLPQTGARGVECRTGGAGNDHQIVATFVEPVTFTNAVVSAGTGVISGTSGNGTNVVTIDLTGVTNAQNLTITLTNVSEGGPAINIPITFGVLLGDVSGNGTVSASDIGQTKAQSGQPVFATNFRTDVNASGGINASDIGQVRAQSGTQLPP